MDPISPGMLRNGFTGENPKLQACVSGKVFMFSEVSRFPNCQPIFQRFVFTRVCNVCGGARGGQKRVSDPWSWGYGQV